MSEYEAMRHDLGSLLDGLASPDPAVRDGWAYNELAEGIGSGRFAADWDAIRESALEHLRSDEPQARSFAPLVLRWLVLAGDREEAGFRAVAAWYLSESDTRGYDDGLGWLHAVAHGADYLAAAAKTGIAGGNQVLELLARRTALPGPVWRDQENARVAYAALQALSAAHGVNQDGVRTFAAPISDALSAFEAGAVDGPDAGRPPAWLTNVYSTLATLYVAVAEDALPDEAFDTRPWQARLRAELAALMSRMTPWLFTSPPPIH
jgi:hypothetical protein